MREQIRFTARQCDSRRQVLAGAILIQRVQANPGVGPFPKGPMARQPQAQRGWTDQEHRQESSILGFESQHTRDGIQALCIQPVGIVDDQNRLTTLLPHLKKLLKERAQEHQRNPQKCNRPPTGAPAARENRRPLPRRVTSSGRTLSKLASPKASKVRRATTLLPVPGRPDEQREAFALPKATRQAPLSIRQYQSVHVKRGVRGTHERDRPQVRRKPNGPSRFFVLSGPTKPGGLDGSPRRDRNSSCNGTPRSVSPAPDKDSSNARGVRL